MKSLFERCGPWAVVTGASSGIGEVFAQRLAAAGFHLVIAARRLERLEALRDRLTDEHGIEVRCLQVDLSEEGGPARLIEGCQGLEVGLLVNNAGSGVPGSFAESDVQLEKGYIQLNCTSPMELSRHFLGGMLERGKGGVLLVSSLMGFQGVPYMANYSATKGWVLNFGEALHHECQDTGVEVMVLAPGATETPGKYLHPVDYSKIPVRWMAAEDVVDAALDTFGRKAFLIPGVRNHLTACLSGGLWSRGFVQGLMRRLAQVALPLKEGKEPSDS